MLVYGDMSSSTIANIGVAMFAVADQDAAIAYYTDKLGWEVRADVGFGEGHRWVEVAPRDSTARLALNPPMEGEPGGGSIGVETADVKAEYEHLKSVDGVQVGDMMGGEDNVPPMFSIVDPDGNYLWVVEAPPAS